MSRVLSSGSDGGLPSMIPCTRFPHDGRLWVRLACLDEAGEPLAGWFSVMRFSISQADEMAVGLEPLVIQLERLIAGRDASLRQQAVQMNQLERQLSERNTKLAELEETLRVTYQSRSWRLTAPLRKMKKWLS